MTNRQQINVKPYGLLLIVALSLFGLLLLSVGAKHLNFFVQPKHALYLALLAGLLWLGERYLYKSAFQLAFIGALGLALLTNSLWPVLVIFWFIASATLLGRWLLRRLGWRGASAIQHFLTGACLYGTTLGLLAHWPINYRALYALGLALPLWLGRRVAWRWFHRVRRRGQDVQPHESWLLRFVNLSLAAIALHYFTIALMPELGYDALWMHLFVPTQIAAQRAWGFDASVYVWAVIPMMGDWLFSWVYLLGGETATRLLNFAMTLLITFQVRQWACWAGSSSLGANAAALVFLSSPLTFTTASVLFIEPVWAAFLVTGGLTLCQICFTARRRETQLVVAGLLLGAALAAKAVTFTMLPPLAVVFLWGWRAWAQRKFARPLWQGCVALGLLGMVPYVRAWWLTGNPVFPFFNKVFRSPLWYPQNFEASTFGKGLTWDFLYQVVFHTGRYSETVSGAAGFQWILLFLPLVALIFTQRHRKGLIILWIGVVAVWLPMRSTAYIRYVYPATALLTAGLGLLFTWSELQSRWLKQGFRALVALTVFLQLVFLNTGSPYSDFPWRTLLSETHRQQYLAFRIPIRVAVKIVNEANLPRTPVAVLGDVRVAGLTATAYEADWTNRLFLSAIEATTNEADVIKLLKERRITYAILNNSWNSANPNFVNWLKSVCDNVANVGHFSVLRLKPQHRFGEELIRNSQPISAEHWGLTGNARYESGVLICDNLSPATQEVAVTAGQSYLFGLETRCRQHAATPIRMQVNWLDAQKHNLYAEVQTYNCTGDWKQVQHEIVAPAKAATARVQLSSETAVPAEFRNISFR